MARSKARIAVLGLLVAILACAGLEPPPGCTGPQLCFQTEVTVSPVAGFSTLAMLRALALPMDYLAPELGNIVIPETLPYPLTLATTRLPTPLSRQLVRPPSGPPVS